MGKPDKTVDYSIDSLNDSLLFVNGTTLATSGTVLRREDKCNVNDNCAGDLVCFQQGSAAMIPWPGCCGMGRKQTPCCDDAGIASRPSTNPKIAKTSVPCKQWKGVFECCVECKGDVRYSWRHAGEAPVLVLGYCGLSRKGPNYCVPSALASPWLLCCSTLSLPL